jgi:Domain of unknown function (DUF3291)
VIDPDQNTTQGEPKMKCINWAIAISLIIALGDLCPAAADGIYPAKLEVNMPYVAFDYYDGTTTNDFVNTIAYNPDKGKGVGVAANPGCVSGASYRSCIVNLLNTYADQGVTGILLNMSVWETVDALKLYVYRTAHAELIRQRQAWFEKFAGVYLALWWVPAGHLPNIDEAKERLAHLAAHGPTEFAFTFQSTFQVPSIGLRRERQGLPLAETQ